MATLLDRVGSATGKIRTQEKAGLQERAHMFAIAVIRCVDGLSRGDLSAEVLGRQLLRSATSIGANINEAQAGSSRKDFTNFFLHALKSANETKFWLALLRDARKVETATIETLLQEAEELSRILGASVLTLRGKR